MRQLLFICLITLWCSSSVKAQQFISINPDLGQSGQLIFTVVTGSQFFFTWGSAPGIWGDFYMKQGNQFIYPSSVNVIDDDHLGVYWPIPNGVPIGNYDVIWELSVWQSNIPGGFNIDCVPPPAVITDNGVLIGCHGDSVLLQANTGPGFTYQWYNYGVLLPPATSSDFYAHSSGSYQVKITDSQGCARFSAPLVKSFVNPPSAIISPSSPAPICVGGSVNLYANFSASFTYQWFFNGNPINGATTQSIAASDSGSYTVRVTNSSGCTKLSNPVTVSYGGGPPAAITPSGPTTFCAGSNIDLVANAGTGYTYQWFKYGNLIPGATGQTLTVNTAGVYKVQVTDASGCSTKSGAVTVSVIAAPPAIISLIGASSICPGDSTLLLANSGTGYTYQWYKYGQPIAGATSQSIYVKNAGQYKVRVIHPLGCSRKSQGVFITLLPAPSATITPQGSTAICAGDNVILQANTGAGYTYEWKKFANIIPGETSSSYSATTAGKYRVIVTGTNGCFRVSNPVDVTIVCREMLEQSVSEILIYPNPANEFISINATDITLIKIMDSKGRVIMTLNDNPHQIDITSLPPGLYLTLIYRDNDVFTGRFVKN